ncbi:type II toxin-antitoxin system VapC family toxin [Nocardioides marmoriginsengisoli]|uniref:Ribonuclease VapC n=1 Tax=Nocardioides marmoriginsengisoli TaxID=661483 RepID=A0A3N0CFD2_9ACTN|nr:type II toxin-antitoxin system VapC family toxin [Nocardioides marmoriginsengisoli]RNL61999.1 type II toxin-antitoxin system VapC family toxin [Nocardioides marmoriginsengisoli]
MPTSADLLLDTSAAVPFLVRTHVAHAATHQATSKKRLGLAGHAAFETFSVITRLPEPSRVSPDKAALMLRHNFPHTRHLSARRANELIAKLARSAISGGAVYDALVAAAAVEHGCVLMTRDARALNTYSAMGADVILLK